MLSLVNVMNSTIKYGKHCLNNPTQDNSQLYSKGEIL